MVATLIALALVGTWASPSWAATENPEARIPQKPTAPPALTVQPPQDVFQCDRFFTYEGKTLTCDSNVRRDAEGLRPILNSVPEAVAELNAYQENRLKIRSAAYVASGGLVLALTGLILGGRIGGTSGALVRNVFVISGLGTTAGSFIYGLGVLRTNESRLGTAVQLYNTRHPENPIELQFSTGIAF